MRYADTLLTEGERIVVRARQHWLALLIDSRTALALWFVAALLIVAVLVFRLTPPASDILSYAALAAIVVGLVVFAYHFWKWRNEDYLITNRRILKVEGIFNKRSADSSLEKINDAVLEQNMLGRMLDYGDLDILTASDTAVDRYRMLRSARNFKREMLNQKHALETEFAYGGALPTPPFRTDGGGPDLNGDRSRGDEGRQKVDYEEQIPERAAGSQESSSSAPPLAGTPLSPPPPPPPPRAPVAADTTEITQTLARLADLRDRGAITAQDYDAKKAELLGRL